MNMRTRKRTKANIDKVIVFCFAAVVVSMMSGCNDGKADAPKNNNNTMANDVLQTDFSNKAKVDLQPTTGVSGKGEATITYNQETKVMSVEVQVTGLEPDSEYMQHIHQGNCAEYGDIIHSLDNLKANGDGEASTTNTFQDVEQFDVSNMVLNIHQGPDMVGDNANQMSCGIVIASE